MLTFSVGTLKVVVGVLVAGTPHASTPIGGPGVPISIYDTITATTSSVGACETLGGGGVVLRCEARGDPDPPLARREGLTGLEIPAPDYCIDFAAKRTRACYRLVSPSNNVSSGWCMCVNTELSWVARNLY